MEIYSASLLEGQTAVVTGASRGIGRAIALEMAKAGANVAMIYCGNSEAANDAAHEISAVSEKIKVSVYKCDVSDSEEVNRTVAEIIKDFGKIDILVNNAGVTRDGLIMQLTDEDFDKVINVNLRGAFNMTRAVSRPMIRQKSGRICNISSVAGITGNAGQTNYSASKAGIIGLTKSAAQELSKRGITVNAIAPGFVSTDMTKNLVGAPGLTDKIPLGRVAEPAEVASLAVFLCSQAASYITGEVIRIDGGMAM